MKPKNSCAESGSKQKIIEKSLQGFQKVLETSIPGPSQEIQEFVQSNKNNEKCRDRDIATKATKRCGIIIEKQHSSLFKKVRKEPVKDANSKYGCSFCLERFPSLTLVREHTRALHRQENERRKEEKAKKQNGTKSTSVEAKNVRTTSGTLNEKQNEIPFRIFRCKSCNFASSSYDGMIQHCQSHVIESMVPGIIDKGQETSCVIDDEELTVDMDTYNEIRKEFEVKNSYFFIYCDYELLKQDKWPAIIDDGPKHELNKINVTSIFYFTRIISLTSQHKPSSAPFTLFQCKKCMKFIDPHCLLKHVQENSCHENLAHFLCYECGVPFLDENAMYLHYNTHKHAAISNIKYRTVLFNFCGDDVFNAILLKAAGLPVPNMRNKSDRHYEPELQRILNRLLTSNPSKAEGNNMQNTQNHSKTVLNSIITNDNQKATRLNMQESSGSNGLKNDAKAQVGTTGGSQIKDARTMIIKATKNRARSEIKRNIVDNQIKDTRTIIIEAANNNATSEIIKNVVGDKVTTVYKCQCELCFHTMDVLFKHLENCPSESVSMSNKISCICGLVFDEQQYQLHYGIHSQGFTKLNVKRITVCDEKNILSNNKSNGNNSAGKTNNNATINTKTNDDVRSELISKLTSSILNVANTLPHNRGSGKLEEKGEMPVAENRRSVGSGTGDLNISVKSQGTMTIMEAQSTHEVNKDFVLKETKSVGSGTDDLNISTTKSQGTMAITEVQTAHEVNKDFALKETKSVGSGTDDLNIPTMKSQETMTVTVVPTDPNENKNVELMETESVGSATGDVEISKEPEGPMTATVMKTVCEEPYDNKQVTLSKQDVMDESKNKEVVDSVTSDCHTQKEKDNTEDNQSMIKTIGAETKEKRVIEKTNSNESVAYSREGLENTVIIETIHDDSNEIIDETYNMKYKNNSQENNATATNTEINNEFEESNESRKDKDMIESQQIIDESKEYTEDELLNGPVYFDAEESLLTDDEDPILIYDDDDILD